MARDKPPTPHRIVSLDHLIPEHPDYEPVHQRAQRLPAPDMFAGYAIIFNEEWPARPIEYLRWSATQMRVVAPVLNRSAKFLNVTLREADPAMPEIKPANVLCYVVRNWRALRTKLGSRFGETPLPDQISKVCTYCPGQMDEILLGLFGRRLQLHLADRSRKLHQKTWLTDPATQHWVEREQQKVWEALSKLVKQVPWLQDGDFLDVLSGEQIGQRRQTMH